MQSANDMPFSASEVSAVDREKLLWSASGQYMRGEINVQQLEDIEQRIAALHELKRSQEGDLKVILREKAEIQSRLINEEIHSRLAEQELKQLRASNLVQIVISLMSMILLGFGINLVTSMPSSVAGWIMITAFVIMQIISLLLTSLPKAK